MYLDNSMLISFNKCRALFYARYVLHLVPRASTNAALVFGEGMHKGLEHLYLGGTLEESIQKFEKIYGDTVDPQGKRTLLKGRELFEDYVKQWMPESFKVLYTEKALKVEVCDDLTLVGKGDLIVQQNNRLVIMDHKTTSNMSWVVAKPNHQVTIYLYAARKQFGLEINDFIFNIIGVFKSPRSYFLKKHKDIFMRVPTTRSAEDIKLWLQWVYDTKTKIDQCIKNNWFPSDCTECWKCPYKELCNATDERTKKRIASGLYKVEKWEPWKA